jgi:hypothetical protein
MTIPTTGYYAYELQVEVNARLGTAADSILVVSMTVARTSEVVMDTVVQAARDKAVEMYSDHDVTVRRRWVASRQVVSGPFGGDGQPPIISFVELGLADGLQADEKAFSVDISETFPNADLDISVGYYLPNLADHPVITDAYPNQVDGGTWSVDTQYGNTRCIGQSDEQGLARCVAVFTGSGTQPAPDNYVGASVHILGVFRGQHEFNFTF